MYQVSELIGQKGSGVATISPRATVLKAAQAMNERRIGSLVVIDGSCVVGIITERDILTRIVAVERSPSKTLVEQVMTPNPVSCVPETPNPVSCVPETPLEELRSMMHERRVRHIPVLDAGRLAGMVSIGDLNAAETKALVQTVGYLKAYIAG